MAMPRLPATAVGPGADVGHRNFQTPKLSLISPTAHLLTGPHYAGSWLEARAGNQQ
jgi:hypothetical protein